MEKLISNRGSIIESVPESYVLPPESRPGKLVVPLCNTIPVIDLQRLARDDPKELIPQMMKASQEYGFFQLINHGVSEELMKDALRVGNEVFKLPEEEKARFYSDDPKQSCRFKTSIDHTNENVHFWRDNFKHPCHPVEDHIHQWPTNPSRYSKNHPKGSMREQQQVVSQAGGAPNLSGASREPTYIREVMGRYSVEVRKLGLRILDLICEGLGLELGYFGEGLSQGQLMSFNHYPPCPDPSLVLGLPKHGDPYLLTLLNQGDVPGLQVLKDEQWLSVEPLPNAFVVNINHTLQIISNGKLKSVDHRVVASLNVARTTVVSFILPSNDSLIEPAKSLLNQFNPPIYKTFTYKDFMKIYFAAVRDGKDDLQHYMVSVPNPKYDLANLHQVES